MTMLIMHAEFPVRYSSESHDIPDMIAQHVVRIMSVSVIRSGLLKGEDKRCYLTILVDNVLGKVHEQALTAIFHEILVPFGASEDDPEPDIVITTQQSENLLEE